MTGPPQLFSCFSIENISAFNIGEGRQRFSTELGPREPFHVGYYCNIRAIPKLKRVHVPYNSSPFPHPV